MAAQLDSEETVRALDDSKKQTDSISQHRIYRHFGKRFFDIVFSICGLVVCAIPMGLVAVLVRSTSPGPAFFCQLRAGQKGKLFVLYKFRSMYTSAPEKSNHDFTQDAMEHYVTKLGKFMRRTSLDELPQMLNVLKGDMSIIGPRPLAKTDNCVLEKRAKSGADRIRPGISGLAQVNGRNEISDELKARWDAEYATTYSMSGDLLIIVRTFVEVFHQRGINHKDNV